MRLRLGTRGSELALIQARMVQQALTARGIDSELVTVRTTGDVKHDAPIRDIGGVGVFTRELDEAVRDGRVDAAVHSLKDVPTIERGDLAVAAVLARDAPGDALVGAPDLAALPRGASVGTSSLRRRAQLLRARPDLDVQPLRGNVPTRLSRVREGRLDAVLLSRGGLVRLGLGSEGAPLDPRRFPHAPGQGVVAVVAREAAAIRALAAVDHADTRVAAEVEREVMAALGGGCLAALGVYAEASGSSVQVHAQVLDADGRESVEAARTLPRLGAALAARALAEAMAADGARSLLAR